MYVFPTLSIPPVYPLEESYEDLTIRTGYEAGYDHTRPRYTTAFRKTYNVKYTHINQYDKILLSSFVTYVDEGLSTFTWANPTKNNVVNLVTNGGFNVNTDGWGINNCTVASIVGGFSGNCAEVTRVQSTEQIIDRNITLEASKRYRYSLYAKSGSAGDCPVYTHVNGSGVYSWFTFNTFSTWNLNTIVFDCTVSGTHNVAIDKINDLSGTILFDEVSVTEATSEVGVRFATLPKYSYIKKGYWDCDFTLTEA